MIQKSESICYGIGEDIGIAGDIKACPAAARSIELHSVPEEEDMDIPQIKTEILVPLIGDAAGEPDPVQVGKAGIPEHIRADRTPVVGRSGTDGPFVSQSVFAPCA